MRNSLPYGDIFLVQTPTLDRLGQQLYQEQKIREQRQMQENAALDAGIQKELGKVRSVDTPEVINSYNQYKQIKKQLLFNKDLQKNPQAYNDLQLQAQRAYQNIFTTANKSAEVKDMQKQLLADRIKNSNAYADDAGERIATLMNTPIRGLSQHPIYGDLTNWDNYRYQGSNTNWADHLQKAMGTLKPTYSQEEVMDKGLQTKITPYSYGNTPGQVKDYLLGTMALHQAGRDAAYQWDHTPEKDIEETIKAYQGLPKEYWQRIGLNGPQDLLPKNPDNKAENYASLQAMKYAISNAPREGTPVFRDNKAAVMAAQEAKEKRMQALRHANAKELIAFKKSIDPNDTEMNNSWVENYLNNVIAEAKADPKRAHDVYGSKGYNGRVHEIPQDSVIEKAFTRGAGKDARTPDKLYATDDGRIYPVFYKYVDDGKGNSVLAKNKAGHPEIDESYGGPLSMDQAKLALGYRGQTKKELGGTMSRVYQNEPKQPSARKYNIDGKTYSHDQLRKLYSEEKIKEYLDAGIIK